MSPRDDRRTKIAVVGAGSVGATLAYACLVRGVGRHLALFDIDREKVEAQVLDLNHGLQFVPTATVEGSDDIDVCAGASVVVITAGAKQKPGQTRMDLAGANTELCRTLVPRLVERAPDAVLLLVTNPVDVITYVTLQVSGLPARRVFGSGTVLDSSRFRFLLGARCGVAVQNVHAYIVGEHGDSEIPLWSSASIAHIPVDEWPLPGGGRLSADDRDEIFTSVRDAAYRIVRGKGATNYAIGLASTQILEAVVNDEKRVLPVSSRLDGYRGVADVCLSVPCVVDGGGVAAPLEVPMDDGEVEGLRGSAAAIHAAIRAVGF